MYNLYPAVNSAFENLIHVLFLLILLLLLLLLIYYYYYFIFALIAVFCTNNESARFTVLAKLGIN